MKILSFLGDLGYRGYLFDLVYSEFGTEVSFQSKTDMKIGGQLSVWPLP